MALEIQLEIVNFYGQLCGGPLLKGSIGSPYSAVQKEWSYTSTSVTHSYNMGCFEHN